MTKSALHEAYTSLLARGRLHPNPGQAALANRLAQLQAELQRPQRQRPTRGLYIYGSVGTGKSRLADLFASTLPTNITRRRSHFHEFMLDIHTRLHRARSAPGYTGDPLLRIGADVARESRVLCFDEFQVSDIADAMILSRLLGAVWSAGGVLVSTSNRHPDRLYENGLNRSLFLPFLADLQRRCEVIMLHGDKDYRLSPTNARRDVYFTDAVAFNKSLGNEMGQNELQTTTIPVMMNRSIRVEACQANDGNAKAIVLSSFADLCQRNLGAADYHALCSATATLYLTGLRRFEATELDHVRRLITLIDLAYETRTRLVCLADVPLADMFRNVAPSLPQLQLTHMTVKGAGGSSSSMMSTFVGETEWSATGLTHASLAAGGAGETDARFAIARAVSRLAEMEREDFGVLDSSAI